MFELENCYYCDSATRCAINCNNAPWNFDKLKISNLGYLKRYVRWLRDECNYPIPLPYRPHMFWI